MQGIESLLAATISHFRKWPASMIERKEVPLAQECRQAMDMASHHENERVCHLVLGSKGEIRHLGSQLHPRMHRRRTRLRNCLRNLHQGGCCLTFPSSSPVTRTDDVAASYRNRNTYHGCFRSLKWILGAGCSFFEVNTLYVI